MRVAVELPMLLSKDESGTTKAADFWLCKQAAANNQEDGTSRILFLYSVQLATRSLSLFCDLAVLLVQLRGDAVLS